MWELTRPRKLWLRKAGVGRGVVALAVQKFNLLRKPKTNIQILQQSVLLKYKAFVSFLKEHGAEAFPEVSGRVRVTARACE